MTCRSHPVRRAGICAIPPYAKHSADDDLPGPKSLGVPPMTEVTRILSAIEQGDPSAAEQLLPLVYDELRKLAAQKLAHEKPGQTLEATALVHEAYLRLVGAQKVQRWDSRGHFFAAAAEAMRRILLNRARDNKRAKRGGERRRVDLDRIEIALDTSDEQLIALDEALTQLAAEDADVARLVNLRFFAGITLKDAAVSLGLAQRTAERQWAYARAWLYARLRQDEPAD
jgi:RNA polymerase sigma factor (TIGR02999 family)